MKLPLIIAIVLILSIITIPTCRADDDSDGDGIPDQWETDHGMNPNDPTDALADFDRDDLNNLQEYQHNTSLTDPFSGGRVKTAYTAMESDDNQMTPERIQILLDHGINTFVVHGAYYLGVNYSGYPDHVPDNVKIRAALAKQYNFTNFQGIYCYKTSLYPDEYHVAYSDGGIGTHVSPFCQGYWQHMTDMCVDLANLSVNHPDEYRIDGVFFDFELYSQSYDHRPTFFDWTWGFENQTFAAYCMSRNISNPNIPIWERFDWLVNQSRIIYDSDKGHHYGDYYSFLSGLIHNYTKSMREQIHAVNPHFLIGAYPSPSLIGYYNKVYYLAEIFSGWSTPTDPCVIWATESYNGGGADELPPGIDDCLLPEGHYNLSTIYPSVTDNGDHNPTYYPIYAYYISGLINYYYCSANWAYHLNNLMRQTNGYWIYTTKLFTDNFSDLHGWCVYGYDPVNNTAYDCHSAEEYAEAVQYYYTQMDIADNETRHFLINSTYNSNLTLISPPPVHYQNPIVWEPLSGLRPLNETSTENLSFAGVRFYGQHNIGIYAIQNQSIYLKLKNNPAGWKEIIDGLTWVVYNETKGEILRGHAREDNEEFIIHFIAPYTGNYMIMVKPGRAFQVLQTNVPFGMYYSLPTICDQPATLYFYVQDDISTLSIKCTTYWVLDGFKAYLYKPSDEGYVLVSSGVVGLYNKNVFLNATVASEEQERIWKLTIESPDHPYILEQVSIFFGIGVSEYFSLTNDTRYFLIQPPIEEPSDDPPPPSGGGPPPPQIQQNTPPENPLPPNGPVSIERNVEYSYTAVSTDTDRDQLRYRFDWGDGNISEWSALVPINSSISLSHHWEVTATYEVRVQTQDEHGANSSWSDPIQVTVSENEPTGESPVATFAFSGDTVTNQTIVFNASDSFDLDGVIVSYNWDFGDGENGTGKIVTHTYGAPRTYTITLTVTDNNDNMIKTTMNITVSSPKQGTSQDDQMTPPLFIVILFLGGAGIALVSYRRFLLQHRIQRLTKKIEQMKARQYRNVRPTVQRE